MAFCNQILRWSDPLAVSVQCPYSELLLSNVSTADNYSKGNNFSTSIVIVPVGLEKKRITITTWLISISLAEDGPILAAKRVSASRYILRTDSPSGKSEQSLST